MRDPSARMQLMRRPVTLAVLAVSALAWLWLVGKHQGIAAMPLCTARWITPGVSGTGLRLLLIANPPLPLLMGWLAMLGAMMLPLLLAPLAHIHSSLPPSQRMTAITAFLAGYALVWCMASLPLLALALGLRLLIPSAPLALGIAGLIALLWQVSPPRRACLDHCHCFASLSPHAGRAQYGAALFGLGRGVWCLGTCWALTLVPMLANGLHVELMALITLWLWRERLADHAPSPSMAATWRSLSGLRMM